MEKRLNTIDKYLRKCSEIPLLQEVTVDTKNNAMNNSNSSSTIKWPAENDKLPENTNKKLTRGQPDDPNKNSAGKFKKLALGNNKSLLPMPVPLKLSDNQNVNITSSAGGGDGGGGGNTSETKKLDTKFVKSNSDRNLRIVTGTIETLLYFCKNYINVDALVEVYAHLINIRKGNRESENIIILRNDSGPYLQAVYCDSKPLTLLPGDDVRCIGRFIGQSRLQIMKITKYTEPAEGVVIRLQNICLYTLNKDKKNK